MSSIVGVMVGTTDIGTVDAVGAQHDSLPLKFAISTL